MRLALRRSMLSSWAVADGVPGPDGLLQAWCGGQGWWRGADGRCGLARPAPSVSAPAVRAAAGPGLITGMHGPELPVMRGSLAMQRQVTVRTSDAGGH